MHSCTYTTATLINDAILYSLCNLHICIIFHHNSHYSFAYKMYVLCCMYDCVCLLLVEMQVSSIWPRRSEQSTSSNFGNLIKNSLEMVYGS